MRGTGRGAFTFVELLVILGIVGVGFGLLAGAVQFARETANRARCQNNLRQMGLALHSYHDQHQSLPPGWGDRSDQYYESGWQFRILPYMEEQPIWEGALVAYGQNTHPLVNPPHTGLSTVVAAYICPSDDRLRNAQVIDGVTVAFTSYMGVEGHDQFDQSGVLYAGSKIRFSEIVDGTSTTLLVAERPPSADLFYGWWYAGYGQDGTGSVEMVLGSNEQNDGVAGCSPGEYSFGPGTVSNQCDCLHFWSLHRGGANFLACDGAVHFLEYSAKSVLPALCTRKGGEPVQIP